MIATAQQKATITATSETELEKVLPQEMMFAFPEFIEARLQLLNGSMNSSRVNINLYTGDILFINNAGDTMGLANPGEVKRIIIGESLWIPLNKVFWEVLEIQDEIMLLKSKRTKITDQRKEGAYGTTSGTSAVSSVSSLVVRSDQIATLLPVGIYDFETEVQLRLAKGSKSYVADANGFRKAFDTRKKEITAYLKENRVNFKDEAEVRGFLLKCLSL